MSQPPNKSPGQPPLALSVPLSRFTSQVGGGSAFYVRPHQTFMKFILTLIALTLLLTGCNRDAMLSRKIVGTWQADSSMTEEFNGDGSFLFSKRNSNQTNDFSGEWQIKNGFLILSLKNATGPSPDGHPGDTVSFKIVHADTHYLTCVMGQKTNTLSR
jgi:hypothetical protein